MKKLIALLFAGGIMVAGAASASAERVDTPIGSASNDGGYTLLLDGAEGNPDPFDGYAGVDGNGGVQCGDAGDGSEWYDDNGNGIEDEGERRATDDGCNPGQ